MIFIRPTILRDGTQVAIETNAKYNVMRNQQLDRRKGKVTLIPGERQPLLPPIEELSKYADPTAGAQDAVPAGERRDEDPAVQTTPLREPQRPANQNAPPRQRSEGDESSPGEAAPDDTRPPPQ
jgi:general secretion pathway protein D